MTSSSYLLLSYYWKHILIITVSVSNGSTEGTEVITSGLESFNYKLTGQTSPVHRESIQPKQIIVRNESGVFDNGNG